MLLDQPDRLLGWLLLALLLDALIGDPRWLWARLPHPIVLIGRAINRLERVMLDETALPASKRHRGMLLVLVMVGSAVLLALAAHTLLRTLSFGWLIEAVAGGVLLAQRSLADHVLAVARGLDRGVDAGRAAVAMIVGRDPDSLDEHAVARAAIESAAENFSDGVVAPLLWGLVFGLPGILGYKVINTLDSMIGHRSPRYVDFGRAAARLDDFVNLPASRLSAMLVWIAALVLPRANPVQAWRMVWRDAGLHRSPNAGWPEAAFAGALGIRLCGPRTYGGVPAVAHWIGGGRAEVTADDVRRSLTLLWTAWAVAVLIVAGAWSLTP